MDSALSIYIASGCESCFLLPPMPVVYMSILDDIINFPIAKLIRGRCMRRLNAQAEFHVVRHDGAFKMLMSLPGKPKHGTEIRGANRETSPGAHREIPQTHRRHVAHTLTTVGGATIAASAEYSESRAITEDCVRRILLAESSGDSYLRPVRILYTDRARDFGHGDYWAALPGLLAIARDPRAESSRSRAVRAVTLRGYIPL